MGHRRRCACDSRSYQTATRRSASDRDFDAAGWKYAAAIFRQTSLLTRFFWIVAICLTGLAFTPTWQFSALYSPISIGAILLLFGHGLMVAGFLQQAYKPASATSEPERWLLLLYISGLILLFAALIGLPWASAKLDPAFYKLTKNFTGLMTGVVTLFIAIGLNTLLNLKLSFIQKWIPALVDFLQLRWLFRLMGLLLRGVGRLIRLPNQLLEGQAGLIWAFLLLVLLLTLFTQSGVPSRIGSGG